MLANAIEARDTLGTQVLMAVNGPSIERSHIVALASGSHGSHWVQTRWFAVTSRTITQLPRPFGRSYVKPSRSYMVRVPL